MEFTQQVARHLREFYYGPNMPGINFSDTINGVGLELATKKIGEHNSILALVFHIDYYVDGITKVLEGGELTIRDKFSFDHPLVETEEEWTNFVARVMANGDRFARRIAELDDEKLADGFVKTEYGTHYRNLVGCTEHLYYHLGQIALLKKLLS
ncbi:DUF1572 domain-containing protein [Lewinellaceae bacterium SD302]|nr:DUF1572 domain-containing protein [Lewinellaceae bacterium SD302]